jgi:NADPH:quinone reductase-like Zn-dependent oxidoreductase
MTALPRTMSGAKFAGPGRAETLTWRDDLPLPRPGPGDVLVKVLAAGVNMTDLRSRRGWYGGEGRAAGWAAAWAGEMAHPQTQRADLCGRIVALGAGVVGLALGARVICPTNRHERATATPIHFVSIGSEFDGALAQYCLVQARHLQDVTGPALTDIGTGAMPCANGTAHNLLARAAVAVGERVLVTGASGGVGLAAVHLALLRGAEVTAQCSLAKSALLRDMGATILSRDATPRAQGFDAVIDLLGGEGFQDRLDALRPGGRYAAAGAVGGPLVKGELRRIYLNDLTPQGAAHQPREVFAGLVTVISTARLRPVATKTHPVRDLATSDPAAGRTPGKLVLVSPEPQP